jgi:hypothetical protein
MTSTLKDLWHRLTARRAADENEARPESMAEVIADREPLSAAERAQAQRQTALLRLSAELAATLDEDELCRRVVSGLRETLSYDNEALMLLHETTGERVVAAFVGSGFPRPRLAPGQGLSERPLLDGQLHYLQTAETDGARTVVDGKP